MSKEIKKIIPDNDSILFVDAGNSSVKVAYQTGQKWQQPGRFKTDDTAGLLKWINSRSNEFGLVVTSSVVSSVTRALTEHIRDIKCIVLNIDDIPAVLLDYDTPETLGIDRFFACYGAVARTRQAAVVIDSGTACTIDYISGNYVYKGGVIMPGIAVFEQALKLHAPMLPLVPRTLPASWPGKSTTTSLQWGITGAYLDGIHAGLKRHEKQFGGFNLILTGGDAEWMASVIDWESEVLPLLVFEGMKQFVEDYL